MEYWLRLIWLQYRPAVIAFFAIILVGTPALYGFTKAIDNFHAENRKVIDQNNKDNCLKTYNTIECHQYKIEQLLLDKKYKEVSNAQSKEP